MSMPVALTAGTIIGGHYVIGDLINRGGFGAVYRGVDTSEGNRPCAIKETYDVTPASRRRALMEAGILFTVRNRHLPEVYDALEANGRFYLVMQLIEGQTLLQILKSRVPNGLVGEQEPFRLATGPCSEQEVLAWLLPVIEILQELHSRNPPVMHRDIKPGNIILTPQYTSVLVDFGLTKLYDPNVDTQTMGRAVTPGFSPIEQYVGKTTPQSDLYSMAATMYLLLTNRLPPPAMQRTGVDSIIAPREINPSLSPKIEHVLLKALAVEATLRYENMSEFAQALSESTFGAYSDQTIVAPPATPVGVGPRPLSQAEIEASEPTVYVGGFQPQTQQQMRPPTAPVSGLGPGTPSGPPYSAYPYPYIAPAGPGGPQRKRQRPWQAAQRPLPRTANQGCLWGGLQGIVAALLVLSSHQGSAFYLATFIGFVFYLIAGFFTTRRGGGSLRGGWAGFWTGIYGTMTFWIAFGIGLLLQYLQQLTHLGPDLTPQAASMQAWNNVKPAWPQIPYLLPQQSTFANVIALMLIGCLIAWICGWVGGLIGNSQAGAQQAAPHP
ncbi:MAG TPA: serine/threonine-protein kinase [Dictyobacter sp.]|jgi:serine/threonine protein kinase|nr:serine/threonine-protein kinase [Dictyobacter sp.]